MVATNAAHRLFIHVLHVILACAVSFQITKLGNIESINTVEKFSWVSGTTKIFLHENLKHKNFITRKFSDLRYIQTLYTCGDVLGMRLYTLRILCILYSVAGTYLMLCFLLTQVGHRMPFTG